MIDTALGSWLPPGEANLFQQIKGWTGEAEESGREIIRLSIGQPQGAALLSARQAASMAVMSDQEAWHEYQDNGCIPIHGFAERFFENILHRPLDGFEVDYLPIPGIKPMLGLIPLACGCHLNEIMVATTTNPGYPTPKDWCGFLRTPVQELPLNPRNRFRFLVSDIDPRVRLIMLNYPHNPTGQIATKSWLQRLCAFCEDRGIRIFNDAAYISLSHTIHSVSLAEVAVDFPGLSWLEVGSASKIIQNGTGWRVGAAVGSPDFIGDLKTIKGMTDSGFVAPMAAGVIEALENDLEGVDGCRVVYARRIRILKALLQDAGMQLAVSPQAGFFILWERPQGAFGRQMESGEHFNRLMTETTGIVGVHFGDYYRTAVTADLEDEEIQERIHDVFSRARVRY